LNTALEMGRRAGARLPHSIVIIAIEAVDVSTFGEGCTPEVAAAILQAVAAVLQELGCATSRD
jgi:Ni,Fe-hydrogenase maturation factor